MPIQKELHFLLDGSCPQINTSVETQKIIQLSLTKLSNIVGTKRDVDIDATGFSWLYYYQIDLIYGPGKILDSFANEN